MKRLNLLAVSAVLLLAIAQAISPAWAINGDSSYDTQYKAQFNGDNRDTPHNLTTLKPEPSDLAAMQNFQKSEPIIGQSSSHETPNGANGNYEGTSGDKGDALDKVAGDEKDLALKIRHDSQKEAALSFGARGGLAWRTKIIMDKLHQNTPGLDKSYDFRRLLIKAPSNMFIEPPIISEALNNFVVTNDGNEAAVADVIYEISRQARIVSAPRNWRQYLERDWKDVTAPPDVLLPENDVERKQWRAWVAEGWYEGYKQADEIFQDDLNRMAADFEGMVRYRQLLVQNKVSAPYATLVDRGVSGTAVQTRVGDRNMPVTMEMRVGDRAIRITQPVTLRPNDQGDSWSPPIETPQ